MNKYLPQLQLKKNSKLLFEKLPLKLVLIYFCISFKGLQVNAQCTTQPLVNFPFNGSAASTIVPGAGLAASTTAAFNAANGVATTGTAFFTNATAGGCLQTNVGGFGNVNYDFTFTGASLSLYKTFSIYFQTQRTTGLLTGNHTLTFSYSKNGAAFVSFTGSASTVTSTYTAITASLPVGADNPATSLVIRLNSANNNLAASNFRVDNFQVRALPSPVAPVTTNASICSGATATISATTTGSPGFNWFATSSGGTSLSTNTSYNPVNGDPTLPNPYNNTIPGIYTYYAEANLLGCATARVPATVTVGIPVNVNPTASSGTVCSGSNVLLNANITDGSAPFSISWTPTTFLNSAVIAAPTAVGITATTTYTVSVTDACGGNTSSSITINVNSLPVVVVNTTPSSAIICGTGNISIDVTGANTYNWSPAAGLSSTTGSSVSASPALSTTYTVTGTDINGCTATQTANVVVSPAISLTASATPPDLCFGGNSNLLASAANTNSYSVASVPLNIKSGTTTNVTLANDAMSSAIPLPFNFSFYGINYTQIFISSNGFLQLGTSSGTNGAYGQTLPSVANPNNIISGAWSNLNPAGGGSVTYFETGTAPNRVFVVHFNNVPVVGVLFGNGAASFQMQLFETSNNIEVHLQSISQPIIPSGGQTTLGLKNSNGALFAGAPSRFNNGNWNASNEAWRFSPASTGGYSFSWSPATFLSSSNISNPIAQNVTSGTVYTVTASDVNNCSSTSTVSVSVVSPMVATVSASPSGQVCSGSVVAVAANPLFGKTPYTYSWSNGATTASISPTLTASTTFVVTVSDICGTVVTDSVTIPVIPLPTISLLPSGVINVCAPANSQLLTTTSNAVIPGYQWKKDGLIIPGETNSTYTVTTAGTYSVVITDSATSPACSIESVNAVVSFYSSPSVTVTSSASVGCAGQSALLTATASNGVNVINGSNTSSASITALGTPTVSRSITMGPGVLESAADLTITVNLSHTFAGDLKATLTSPCGTTILFDRPGVPATANGNSNDFGGQYIFNISAASILSETGTLPAGNYKPSDVNGNPHDFSGLTFPCLNTAGTWTLTIQDFAFGDGGTLTSWSVSVNQENYVTTFTGPSSIGITTLSGLHNSIADVQVTPLLTGINTYTVTTSDINGCTASATASVNIISLPAPYFIPDDTLLCLGQIISLEVKDSIAFSGGWPSGTLFDWGLGPNLDSTFLVNGPGIIQVSVTLPSSLGSCSSVSSVANLTFRDSPILNLAQNPVTCSGGSTGSIACTVDFGLPPFRYKYYNVLGNLVKDTVSNEPTDVLNNIPAGLYAVVVYDTINSTYPPPSCHSDSLTVLVEEPTLLTVTQTNPGIDCHGNTTTVIVDATGGTPPYVGTGNFIQAAGSQIYTVSDANGCSANVTAVITQPDPLANVFTTTHLPCLYSTANISSTITGGVLPYNYLWSTGSTLSSLNDVGSGTYTLTVTDHNNCNLVSQHLMVTPGPVTISGVSANPVCRGIATGTINQVVSGGSAPYAYIWNNGTTSANRSNLSNGTYTVTVTDINGCSKTTSYIITQPATTLLINSSKTNVRCYGLSSGAATASPSGGSLPYTYSWNTFPVKTTATITGLTAGVYTCIVTDGIGCSKNLVVSITEPPDMVVFQTQSNVTFPGGNDGSATVSVTGGTPGYSYSWNTIPVKTTTTVTGLTAGTYKCTITDNKSCQKKVSFIISEPFARINNSSLITEDLIVNLFPNPTTGIIRLGFSKTINEHFDVSLIDFTGRVVYNKANIATEADKEYVFDFTGHSKGVYFIRILTADKSKMIRMVIQ